MHYRNFITDCIFLQNIYTYEEPFWEKYLEMQSFECWKMQFWLMTWSWAATWPNRSSYISMNSQPLMNPATMQKWRRWEQISKCYVKGTVRPKMKYFFKAVSRAVPVIQLQERLKSDRIHSSGCDRNLEVLRKVFAASSRVGKARVRMAF